MVAVANWGVWGTKALMVSVAWIGNPGRGLMVDSVVVEHDADPLLVLNASQYSMSLTSKRRPVASSLPLSTRTRFRTRCRKASRS